MCHFMTYNILIGILQLKREALKMKLSNTNNFLTKLVMVFTVILLSAVFVSGCGSKESSLIGQDCLIATTGAKLLDNPSKNAKVIATPKVGEMKKILEVKKVDGTTYFKLGDKQWVSQLFCKVGAEAATLKKELDAKQASLKANVGKEFTVPKGTIIQMQPSKNGSNFGPSMDGMYYKAALVQEVDGQIWYGTGKGAWFEGTVCDFDSAKVQQIKDKQSQEIQAAQKQQQQQKPVQSDIRKVRGFPFSYVSTMSSEQLAGGTSVLVSFVAKNEDDHFAHKAQVSVRFYENGAFIGDRLVIATVGAAEQWKSGARYMIHSNNVSNIDYKISFANNTNQ